MKYLSAMFNRGVYSPDMAARHGLVHPQFIHDQRGFINPVLIIVILLILSGGYLILPGGDNAPEQNLASQQPSQPVEPDIAGQINPAAQTPVLGQEEGDDIAQAGQISADLDQGESDNAEQATQIAAAISDENTDTETEDEADNSLAEPEIGSAQGGDDANSSETGNQDNEPSETGAQISDLPSQNSNENQAGAPEGQDEGQSNEEIASEGASDAAEDSDVAQAAAAAQQNNRQEPSMFCPVIVALKFGTEYIDAICNGGALPQSQSENASNSDAQDGGDDISQSDGIQPVGELADAGQQTNRPAENSAISSSANSDNANPGRPAGSSTPNLTSITGANGNTLEDNASANNSTANIGNTLSLESPSDIGAAMPGGNSETAQTPSAQSEASSNGNQPTTEISSGANMQPAAGTATGDGAGAQANSGAMSQNGNASAGQPSANSDNASAPDLGGDITAPITPLENSVGNATGSDASSEIGDVAQASQPSGIGSGMTNAGAPIIPVSDIPSGVCFFDRWYKQEGRKRGVAQWNLLQPEAYRLQGPVSLEGEIPPRTLSREFDARDIYTDFHRVGLPVRPECVPADLAEQSGISPADPFAQMAGMIIPVSEIPSGVCFFDRWYQEQGRIRGVAQWNLMQPEAYRLQGPVSLEGEIPPRTLSREFDARDSYTDFHRVGLPVPPQCLPADLAEQTGISPADPLAQMAGMIIPVSEIPANVCFFDRWYQEQGRIRGVAQWNLMQPEAYRLQGPVSLEGEIPPRTLSREFDARDSYTDFHRVGLPVRPECLPAEMTEQSGISQSSGGGTSPGQQASSTAGGQSNLLVPAANNGNVNPNALAVYNASAISAVPRGLLHTIKTGAFPATGEYNNSIEIDGWRVRCDTQQDLNINVVNQMEPGSGTISRRSDANGVQWNMELERDTLRDRTSLTKLYSFYNNCASMKQMEQGNQNWQYSDQACNAAQIGKRDGWLDSNGVDTLCSWKLGNECKAIKNCFEGRDASYSDPNNRYRPYNEPQPATIYSRPANSYPADGNYRPGMFRIDGIALACDDATIQVVSGSAEWNGISEKENGVIKLNRNNLASRPILSTLSTLMHECGHYRFNYSELDANCYAHGENKRRGWQTQEEFNYICEQTRYQWNTSLYRDVFANPNAYCSWLNSCAAGTRQMSRNSIYGP